MDKPSYIDRINAFWNWRMFNPVSGKTMALYFALLHCANRAGFPDEVCIPNSTLLSMVEVGKSDLYRLRNSLVQAELITVREGKKGQAAKYRLTDIIPIYGTNVGTDPGTNVGTNPGTNPGTDPGNIYRQRQDKDIKETPPKGGAKKSAQRFDSPTVEQVREYCKERGNYVDPERFVDFYSAKGWMVGKNHMKDWKAAVRTWERDSHPTPQPAGGDEAAIREWEERHK